MDGGCEKKAPSGSGDPDGCEAFDLRTAIGFPPISEFLLAANRFGGRVPFLNLGMGNAHDRLRRCKLSGGEVRRPTDSAEVVDTLRRQFLPRHLVRDVPRRRLGRADIEAAGRIMRDDFLQHGVLRPRVETHQFVSHVGAGLGQTVLQAERICTGAARSLRAGIEKNPATPTATLTTPQTATTQAPLLATPQAAARRLATATLLPAQTSAPPKPPPPSPPPARRSLASGPGQPRPPSAVSR